MAVAKARLLKKRRAFAMLDAIKLAAGCADCGYNEHACALDFDHLDNKRAGVSKMVCSAYGWQAVLDEIAKCEVVCSNCHRVRTFRRRQ